MQSIQATYRNVPRPIPQITDKTDLTKSQGRIPLYKLNSPVELGIFALDMVVFAYHKGYCHDSDEGNNKHDEPICHLAIFEK